ncbi:hypothetical protein KO493_06705 [Tamlana agarivorans]|uniref:Uncharacterized protein n=1 Tax=Pseudotamlana agarivorans TaxID=481183 RepID=A0ACC5U7T2_9FLAO|nr:hypothetical protein [Tamlana agarivorans]MBU2950381.1 hypothetical protein [Tamlana agarivorans]
MKTNKTWKAVTACLFIALNLTFFGCSNDDDSTDDGDSTQDVAYLVGAAVDEEGYYFTTDNITSGSLSIQGHGAEGWASISVTVDGYLYIVNNTEGLTEKFELTENGPVKVDAISNAVLAPGAFFRYIQATDNGDLFLSSSPEKESGKMPYGIIDLDTFTAASNGFIEFPEVNGKVNLWANGLVQNGKIYFGSLYGDASWANLEENLITVAFDYPSITNPEVLESSASAGMTAGYRTNGTFATETGDLYQYNITSPLWYGNEEVADKPSVFVKISNGDYDDSYVLNVSAHFGEPVTIWNAWYAANGIAYANVVRAADVPEWGDLSQNTGALVEIDLYNETITELNLPKAPFVNIFTLDCVENGNFYIPVSIAGGEANIYEINIDGGANGFTKGAKLDGSNVYVDVLQKVN